MTNEQKRIIRNEILKNLTKNQYQQIVDKVGIAICIDDIGLSEFKKITKNERLIKLYIRLISDYKLYLVS